MALTLELAKKGLMQSKPSFEQMNLNKLNFAKEMEYAIQAFQGNPSLLGCDVNSVNNCLVNVVMSGLSLSPVLKQAYLVPRKGKCCLDPSYQGLVKIVTDSGSVTSIKAQVVYENEPFEIEKGTNGYVKHGICKKGPLGARIGAYSIAVLNDGSNHIEWMYEAQLMDIKARAMKTGGAVWKTDEDEMCRKTVIKRHWKFLPKSERAQMAAHAIAFDDEANGIDFEKEKVGETINDTLDTDYEEIITDNIPEAVATEVMNAPSKKVANGVWNAHPELHEFPEFAELLKKRHAEIDLAIMQHQAAQQTTPQEGDQNGK